MTAARFVLGCLIARHLTLLSVDELVREIAGSSQQHGPAQLVVDDGLVELLCSGLAHRLYDFVFASQARCARANSHSDVPPPPA